MMKKWISILLRVILMGTMAACSNPSNTEPDSQENSVPSSNGSEEVSQPGMSGSTESAAPSRPEEDLSLIHILGFSFLLGCFYKSFY